jgi:hypothetical protein
MIEPLLLVTTRVTTFDGKRLLTGASGFFFERERRLFLVTGRHVVIDEPSKHFPNRIEIDLHIDVKNLARSMKLSVMLYLDGKSVWRHAVLHPSPSRSGWRGRAGFREQQQFRGDPSQHLLRCAALWALCVEVVRRRYREILENHLLPLLEPRVGWHGRSPAVNPCMPSQWQRQAGQQGGEIHRPVHCSR